jgi:uncharacterized protein YjbI with pentapeptide repeats
MSIIIKNKDGELLDIAWGHDSSQYNLSWADLREANLCEADLRWANLREADLSGADLREADLRWADLREADLRWADLREANLCWANLREANLREANLREANLCEADLRWADLSGANLRGANLRGANLCGAHLMGTDTFSIGTSQRGYLFLLRLEGDEPRIQAGCRDFTMAEARAHWEAAETHANNPLLRAEILGKLDAAERIIAAHAALKGASQ